MVLHVKNLSVHYGAKRAVDRLSMSVKPGQVVGLLGANGAGKSSAISAMLGVQECVCEALSIFGKSPVTERKEVFQKVGVQFQETNFQDKLTVREAWEQWVSLYKETADLAALLRTFGLEEKQNRSVKSLSGGERQRLAVLLAFIPNPELVFLDELTTGLDTKARRVLWKELLTMKKKGLAMVLSSHFMDEVEALCDEIVILRDGQTVFQGNIREAIDESPSSSLEEAYLYFSGEEEPDI